jgi:conflict system pore-forming effector with SLATT domain/uncharacterized protein DUF4231
VSGIPLRVVAASAGAVALALIPLLSRRFLSLRDTRDWQRARSVSEGIKSEVYKFRACAAPYDVPKPLTVLQRKVREIQDAVKDMRGERMIAGAPTKPAPPQLDSEAYLTSRVEMQITRYYRPKARENAVLAQRFQTMGMVVVVLAAALSTLAAVQSAPSIGPWVAVLMTVAVGLSAYAAANRYDFQSTTFAATARQLEDLADSWRGSDQSAPSKDWSELVRNCEETISAENRGWMAKLDL